MGSLGPKLSSCGQRRLWSDWADAQADLSLRWVHTHFVGFVMSRLINTIGILSIWSDRQVFANSVESGQGLHCLELCLHLWMHYCMVDPHCSNFRIITAIFLGVRIFLFFMKHHYGWKAKAFLFCICHWSMLKMNSGWNNALEPKSMITAIWFGWRHAW